MQHQTTLARHLLSIHTHPWQAESLWLHCPSSWSWRPCATACLPAAACSTHTPPSPPTPGIKHLCYLLLLLLLLWGAHVVSTCIESAVVLIQATCCNAFVPLDAIHEMLPCSGQIGFRICSNKAADGRALDTRVPRQAPPQRGDYPPLRWASPAPFMLPCSRSCSASHWCLARQYAPVLAVNYWSHSCMQLTLCTSDFLHDSTLLTGSQVRLTHSTSCPGCRYYNSQLHMTYSVLLQFAMEALANYMTHA